MIPKNLSWAAFGSLLACLLMECGPELTRAQETEKLPTPIQAFRDYGELLARLKRDGHTWRVLGAAPDGSPVVAVRGGGSKQPPILISAGAHATEHAGVVAAVELLKWLKTSHELWVIPCRDPVGLSGFRQALRLGLGEVPELASVESADALLRKRGEILVDTPEATVVVLGEFGYATQGLYRKLEKGHPALAPLAGRRIYFPSRTTDMPGAGPLERAYTLVVTPDGEILHLNRFHDTPWAPAEVRAIRQLMAEIRPGLTLDLHEHASGSFFWMSGRKQRTEEDESWEQKMARAALGAVRETNAELASEEYSPGSFFHKFERGVYWLDPSERGEGYNLADFAARQYGQAFTVETGMKGPLERRVHQHLLVTRAAVRVLEQRYSTR